jgi:drug/metabolite transporter (DMT)-like permease
VTTLVWGSTWVVIKDQLGSVPPAWSVTWRFALAAVGMFALALIRRESVRVGPEAWLLVGTIGFFQFFANFQMVYQAERYLTSGLVAVMFALLIVPNAVLGRVLLGRRLGLRFVAGSILAGAGIALLMLHEYRSAPVGGSVLVGLAFTAGSILSASIANVLQAGEGARRQSIVVLLAWAMLGGAAMDAAWAFATTGPPRIDWTLSYTGGVAYLALIGSVLTFPLYASLLREWGPGKAAYNGVLIPVVAMALSTLFEGYHWTLLAGLGAALAIAGLAVALGGRD